MISVLDGVQLPFKLYYGNNRKPKKNATPPPTSSASSPKKKQDESKSISTNTANNSNNNNGAITSSSSSSSTDIEQDGRWSSSSCASIPVEAPPPPTTTHLRSSSGASLLSSSSVTNSPLTATQIISSTSSSLLSAPLLLTRSSSKKSSSLLADTEAAAVTSAPRSGLDKSRISLPTLASPQPPTTTTVESTTLAASSSTMTAASMSSHSSRNSGKETQTSAGTKSSNSSSIPGIACGELRLIPRMLNRIPMQLRFALNGIISNVLFVLAYNSAVFSLTDDDGTMSLSPATIYIVVYLVFIPLGHAMVSLFVFGWPDRYIPSLLSNMPIGLTAMAMGAALTAYLDQIQFDAAFEEWMREYRMHEPQTSSYASWLMDGFVGMISTSTTDVNSGSGGVDVDVDVVDDAAGSFGGIVEGQLDPETGLMMVLDVEEETGAEDSGLGIRPIRSGEFYSSCVVLVVTSAWTYVLSVYINTSPATSDKKEL